LNYTLSKVQSQGLAKACAVFNEKVVNRIQLTNNGVDGYHFAQILKGLA
jgi:hypothetical protein